MPLIEKALRTSIVKACLAFRCSKTKMIKNITGDGTLFRVPFENCDSNSISGVFTVPQSGIYSVNGITNQKEGVVLIES